MPTSHITLQTSPASRFRRLAGWSYRHRWWAVLAWVAVLIGVSAGAQAVGGAFQNDFSLPGTDSQRALDVLSENAPVQAGTSVQIVVEATDGVASEPARSRLEAMLADVAGLAHVAGVSGFDNPAAISADGTIGYATVTLDAQAGEVPVEAVRELIDTARSAQTDDLTVELGGEAVRGAEEAPGGAAEGAGMLAALVILVILFGSFLAASLPLIIALFAVGATIGVVTLASHVFTVAEFTTPLMVLVGLGVGIDYALLVFSRYRSELLAGADREDATGTALDTAGRTVFFAGCTVIIALLGLVALGLGSLQGVAVAVAVTVLVTMLATLTLLPSLLAIMGRRIERAVQRRARRSRRVEGAGWRRWSALVRRHRWAAATVAVVSLLALAAPALGMRLGFADAGNDPETSTSRRAYDLLSDGFGPGFNGPLVVVAQGGDGAAEAVAGALADTSGIAATTPPLPADAGLATVLAFPDSKPQDEQTLALVERLRDEVLPPLATETGATFLVGGPTAAAEDFATAVADRLPIFVAVVVGLSAVLLLVVFRSLLIPVKAAVLNLLSVAAALGVVTAVFQHGVLGGFLGIQPGPVEAFVPVMIFAIAFGLSMDYEVFLVSRMHEEWERTGDPDTAVSEGLATTGRVVTAAAAIMVVVFAAFLLSPSRMLQQFGLGLAVAVLVDALVIRCLALPAVMQLLGRRAWWLPRPLDRVIPRVALERSE